MSKKKFLLDKYARRRAYKDLIFPNEEVPQFLKDLPLDYVSPAGLTRKDLFSRFDKIIKCSNNMKFMVFESGKIKPWTAHYCNNKLACPVCAGIAEDKKQAEIMPKILGTKNNPGLIKKYKYKYHVTFTIKNGTNLLERYNFLRSSLKRFKMQGQKDSNQKRLGEWAKVKASVISIEIKRGENSKEWHPHAHAMLFCDSPLMYNTYDVAKKKQLQKKYGIGKIPQKELNKIAINKIDFDGQIVAGSKLSMDWRKATLYTSMGIDVRPLFNTRDIEKKVYEVIKYSSCLKRDNADDAMEIIATLSGKRLFSKNGEFRNVNNNNIVEEEFFEPEPEPVEVPIHILSYSYDPYEKHFLDGKKTDVPEEEFSRQWKHYLANKAKLISSERVHRSELIKKHNKDSTLFKLLDNSRTIFKEKYSLLREIWHNILNGKYQTTHQIGILYGKILIE